MFFFPLLAWTLNATTATDPAACIFPNSERALILPGRTHSQLENLGLLDSNGKLRFDSKLITIEYEKNALGEAAVHRVIHRLSGEVNSLLETLRRCLGPETEIASGYAVWNVTLERDFGVFFRFKPKLLSFVRSPKPIKPEPDLTYGLAISSLGSLRLKSEFEGNRHRGFRVLAFEDVGLLADAKFEIGDLIVAVNERKLDRPETYRLVFEPKPGDRITFIRQGTEYIRELKH